MLEIKSLRFGYGKHTPDVLRGIDLTLETGKTGILLGKNGAGKSTLFAAMTGLLTPSSGTVILNSKSLFEMPRRERAKRVAYVPQNITFGKLTVFDSVLMGRMPYFGMHPSESDRKTAAAAIEEMELAHLKDRCADSLSGGEKQKVAIARALAQEPELMIFDEPAGNLDLAGEQLLTAEIKKLARKRNITVLTAFHDLNCALDLGDTFFFMKDGIISHCGGKTVVTENIIRDVYGVGVKILNIENRKIIIGENQYEA